MPKTVQRISAYDRFINAINSDKTKTEYIRKVNQYQKFFKIKSWNDYIKKNPDSIHEDLEVYISYNKKQGIRNHSIKNKINPVLLLLQMNRIVTHNKILKKQLPLDDRLTAGKEPFTNDDIRIMLEVTKSLRSKALIHFWASTGCRPASITDPVLRKKHLVKMPNDCLALKIYDESREGYWSFLTPEAARVLNRYLQSRQINGENITDESPIFINSADIHDTKGAPITTRSAREIMFRVIKKAGIQRMKIGPRYDKAAIYAFRHRFNTILKINNDVNSNIAEKLMAHKRGLDGTYLNPTREECFTEFVKAIPELTIDETQRQELKIAELENETNALKAKDNEIQELKAESTGMRVQLDYVMFMLSQVSKGEKIPTLEDFRKVIVDDSKPEKSIEVTFSTKD